jgi:hypothetical protein
MRVAVWPLRAVAMLPVRVKAGRWVVKFGGKGNVFCFCRWIFSQSSCDENVCHWKAVLPNDLRDRKPSSL